MGCMVTRPGLARHAYAAAPAPAWVTRHAVTAVVQHPQAGRTFYPVSGPLATFASDGAPFYNTGYQPPALATGLPGGEMPVRLPPVAAQLDLTDRQSWDRPVFFPGSA